MTSRVISLRKILYSLAVVCVAYVEHVSCRYEFKIKTSSDPSKVTENTLWPKAADISEIPGQFELSGARASKNFAAYFHNIETVAHKHNLDVKYKVTVETSRSGQKRRRKMKYGKRMKKFNVPLKKESMKLSSLELMMRKKAEDHSNETTTEAHTTTESGSETSTKPIQTGKYKPIIGAVRSHFRSKVAPVKKDEITLNSSSNFGVGKMPF